QAYNEAVYPLILEADSLLDELARLRDGGQTADFRIYTRRLESVLDQLVLQTRPVEDQLEELGRLEDALDDPGGSVYLPDRQPRPEDVGPPEREGRRAA
ncbi:hypothetical protein R0J87_19120, partial [Halomonas sp. SIMBA_159]